MTHNFQQQRIKQRNNQNAILEKTNKKGLICASPLLRHFVLLVVVIVVESPQAPEDDSQQR